MTNDHILGFIVGAVVNTIVAIAYNSSKAERRRKAMIVHCRGTPGGFFKSADGKWIFCASGTCMKTAQYMDRRGRFFCYNHTHEAEGNQVEQAILEYSNVPTGKCLTHGMDCPHPWSVE